MGLPLQDGVTNEGKTVSTVLPAEGCWEYLLYHIMSVGRDGPKSETDKLHLSTVDRPSQIHKAMTYEK